MASDELIVALATPPGRGAIAVVRASGPDVSVLMAGLLGRTLPSRTAVLADFLAADGEAIDQGLALYFPAPRSYTGEEMLELQGHGGVAVANRLLARCVELGARPATPGEFTQRAFLNGKMDLAQAESVADLIEATSAEAARWALRSLRGDFSQTVKALAQELMEFRVLVEGSMDFPEEGIDFMGAARAEERLGNLRHRLNRLHDSARQGAMLREGVRVVLAGRPNVGKSSLLNRLAEEEVAIVTEIPGTTRDLIRQHLQINGIPLHVVDTAGLRMTRDPVEQAGIDRARAAIATADLVLQVVDASAASVDRDAGEDLPAGLPRIRVENKLDLLGENPVAMIREGLPVVRLSAKTGAGLNLLKTAILQAVGWQAAGEGLFMARARHLAALRQAAESLEAAAGQWGRLELVAEELSSAHRALGRIVGEFTSDALLGEIFSHFCIGK